MHKIIYEPVKPFIINQHFGENKACVSTDGKKQYITCDGNNPPKGYKSLYGKKGHLGVDLYATRGREVVCAQRGVVYKIDNHERSGLDVRVESEIDGRKIRHIYEHLQGYQTEEGDKVETGQLIGWADNTGYSSGDHLHFQVEELIDGKWVHIDPMQIMERTYAKDILAINHSLKYLAEQIAMLADRLADFIRRKTVDKSKG